MPKLQNKLHENFAQEMAKGKTPTEIYRILCPDAKNPNTLGSRLWNRRDIRERISEISGEAADDRNMTIRKKRDMLRKQILGMIPTKVTIRSNRKVETFDMLGAIMLDSRMAGHLAHDGKEPQDSLTLHFKFKDRRDGSSGDGPTSDILVG
ncbi:MAG: hypothetical protein RL630_387 [Verrucomicrobiota bacterium]|jgi:hypothetical protein